MVTVCVCVCTLPREKGYHSTETSGYDNIAALLLDDFFSGGWGKSNGKIYKDHSHTGFLEYLPVLLSSLFVGGACRQPSMLRNSLLNSSNACTSKTKAQKQMSAA